MQVTCNDLHKIHLKCIIYFLNQGDLSVGFFRDLDARAKSERYRALFRLPKDEKLDGHTDCTLWTPFNKMHILGQMFVSTNYICFTSKEENLCSLIIPLREVNICIFKFIGQVIKQYSVRFFSLDLNFFCLGVVFYHYLFFFVFVDSFWRKACFHPFNLL